MSHTDDIARLLVRELEAFIREITLFPDDETPWRVLPGVTNAAGNLALHVAGNLQHFFGAALGQTSYVRNRELEFATRSGTREQLTRELRAAIHVVQSTLGRMDASALDRPMPGVPGELHARAGLFLLHLVAHTAFHLGQAGYLRRMLTGDTTSASPLPLTALADRQ
jgi:uncharacterized damage-inducible protein DinB